MLFKKIFIKKSEQEKPLIDFDNLKLVSKTLNDVSSNKKATKKDLIDAIQYAICELNKITNK